MSEESFDFLARARALVPKEVVSVDLGGEEVAVEVRGLTAREMNEATKAATKVVRKGKKGKADETEIDNEALASALIAKSVFLKESGERLIPEGQEDKIFDCPQSVVSQLTRPVFRINGMNEPDEEGEGEDEEGNS